MIGICEFGQLLSNGFNEIGVEIEAFDWYLFQDEVQQIFLIMLMKTQIPVALTYFGSISATREYSKRVSYDSP